MSQPAIAPAAMLSSREIAELMRCTERSIRRRIRAGWFSKFWFDGFRFWVPRTEVEKAMGKPRPRRPRRPRIPGNVVALQGGRERTAQIQRRIREIRDEEVARRDA